MKHHNTVCLTYTLPAGQLPRAAVRQALPERPQAHGGGVWTLLNLL